MRFKETPRQIQPGRAGVLTLTAGNGSSCLVGAQAVTAAERGNVTVKRAYRISKSSLSLDAGTTHVLPPRELSTHKCEELKTA